MLALVLSLLVVLACPPTAPRSSAQTQVSEPSSEAIVRADELLAQAKAARAAKDLAKERALIAQASELLLATPKAQRSLDWAHGLSRVSECAYAAGLLPISRAADEAALAVFEAKLPGEHHDVLDAQLRYAVTLASMGELRAARPLFERVLALREKSLPDDDSELQTARQNLGVELRALGELGPARALFEKVLAVLEKKRPDEDPDLQIARGHLAGILYSLGDLPGARKLFEKVAEVDEKTLAGDDPELQGARQNLAVLRRALGDLRGARALEEQVLAVREKIYPEDHPALQSARQNLALTIKNLGELHEARVLEEKVLAVRERTLPDDNPDLQAARLNLATTYRILGDLNRARALGEKALAMREKTLNADHPDLLGARQNLAVTLRLLGDPRAACVLEKQVLAARERLLPDDHRDLQAARLNLAVTIELLGDRAAARALEEKALSVFETTLPDDSPDLQVARMNLGATLYALGDHEAARKLGEKVVAVFESIYPEDHPDLLLARQKLAVTLQGLGDPVDAAKLFGQILAAREKALPDDHPDLQTARLNVAAMDSLLGDPRTARALEERVLAVREKVLPADHPDLQESLDSTIWASLLSGDRLAADRLAPRLLSSLLAAVHTSRTGSPRERAAGASACARELGTLLSLSPPAPTSAEEHDREQRLVGVLETMRAASMAAPVPIALESDPALLRAHEARTALASAITGSKPDSVAAGSPLSELVRERDEAEHEVATLLETKGLLPADIEVAALARELAPNARAVGVWRYARSTLAGDPPLKHTDDCLVAFVIAPDAIIRRVELGEVGKIQAAVDAWRGAIGQPIDRGAGVVAAAGARELETARSLRQLVFAPLLTALGDAQSIELCLDDALHLVPLDALPLETSEETAPEPVQASRTSTSAHGLPKRNLVGERWSIHVRASFAELREHPGKILAAHASSPPVADSSGTFLTIGGVAFNAEMDDPAAAFVASGSEVRAGPLGMNWDPLPQTRAEAENLGALFQETFDTKPCVLIGKRATKKALIEHAYAAHFLHIATHGYFAPDSVPSLGDPPSARVPATEAARANPAQAGLWSSESGKDLVTRMAPMTLCGRALAGANNGADSLGRVPGVITAEEMSSLDLSHCELAVLSACETNCGIVHAGQAIHSLQSALHAAGARTAITSLWKVDDERTRELFADFYTRIWVKHEKKAEALWHAKMALRAKGAATRDWAGWILTGDPE